MLTPPQAKKPLPFWLFPFAATLTLMSIAGTVFSAVLIHEHPELLVGLTGDAALLIAAAPRSTFWPLFVLGSIRRALSMVMLYALAAHYGARGLLWARQRWSWIGKVEEWSLRVFGRAGPLLLVFVPSHPTAAVAGMSGMPWRRFLLPMFIGQSGFTALALLVGVSLSEFIDPILAWVAVYKWECTAVIATLVLLRQLQKRRASRRKLDPALDSPGA
ncbi:MAG: membrane protein DedA with SNARE-associated domain [Bradymonadia bacterium]|jgi:membrane protein DedA with SNARE-associated domain